MPAQTKNKKLFFLLYSLLALIIALTVTFGYLALRPSLTSLISHISRKWQNLSAPKIEYTFKSAPSKSGFALLNENKVNGFNVLLGKRDNPKLAEARFEVKDSWVDFSLIYNIGKSEFKKVSPTSGFKDLITWENVLPSVDIQYQMKDDGLKEDIILKDKTLAQKAVDDHELFTLPFYLTTYNVVPRYDLNGKLAPVFIDSKTGEYRFHMETPYIVDANGARYESVEFELKPLDLALLPSSNLSDLSPLGNLIGQAHTQEQSTGSRYLLVLKLPREWLTDPSRAYPVIIDPTVTHNTQTAFATGTMNRVKDEGAGDSTPLLTSSYHELAADIDTVGLWHMNEASGNVADSSGNGNTGTVTGTSVVAGKFGNARSFNGTSDYIESSQSPLNPSTTDFTAEAWFNITSLTSSDDDPIVAQTDGTGTGRSWIYVDTTANDTIRSYLGGAALDSSIIPIAGQWYHAAVTSSGTTLRIYIDGIERASATRTMESSTGALRIGRSKNTASAYFNGQIDEVRISNIARSPEEIKQDAQRFPYSVYNSPVIDLVSGGLVTGWNNLTWLGKGIRTGDGETVVSSTNLVAQWNFNDTPSTATAVSGGSCGTSCNGTLTGFADTTAYDAVASSGWTSNNKRWGAGAIMTDGSSDIVTVPDSNALDLTTNLTLEMWYNRITTTADYACPLDKFRPETTGGSYQICFGPNTSDRPYVNICSNAACTTNASAAARPGSPKHGEWNHVVATYDSQNLKIYLNGVLEETVAATFPVYVSTTGLTIGAGREGTLNYFKGTVDATRIYSRTLTSAEVLANYQAGNIEFQTRTSADNSTWDAWLPVANEAVVANMDTDSANWSADSSNPTSGGITKSDDATTKIDTGSMKLQIGAPQVDASTVGLWHMEETSGTGAYIKDSVVQSQTSASDSFTDTSKINTGSSTTYTVVGGQSKIYLDLGDGSDGAVTFASNFNCQTGDSSDPDAKADCYADNITALASAGATSLTVATDATTGLTAGDEILVIQMSGTGAGNYETHYTNAVTATSITLDKPLTNAYQSSGAQVVRIPNYTNVTINNGVTVNVSAWNGSKGGILFWRANGTVTNNSTGIISANGLGFPGATSVGTGAAGAAGYVCNNPPNGGDGSTSGDSPGASSAGSGPGGGGGGAAGSGGGGGINDNAINSSGGGGGGGAGGPGGGGSYGTAAGAAGSGGNGGAGSNGGSGGGGGGGGGTGGSAGSTYGDASFATIFLGSGGASGGGGAGGGGGACRTTLAAGANQGGNGRAGGNGAAGGNGGGMIMIFADTITNSGTIRANGSAGASLSLSGTSGNNGTTGLRAGGGGGGGAGGAGGGGSGGAVWLSSITSSGNTPTVSGGTGGGVGGSLGGTGGACYSQGSAQAPSGGGGGGLSGGAGASCGTGSFAGIGGNASGNGGNGGSGRTASGILPTSTSATIQSANLLSGTATSIDSFVYNLSSKPGGTTSTIQFSTDGGSTWTNAAGTGGQSETLTTGTNNTITFTGGSWASKSSFIYKISFSGDSTTTPVIDDITLYYVPASYNGTPTGTTVVDGFYGKTRSFNGTNDYIDIGTGPTSVKSVEFWVNPVTTTEYFVNITSTTDRIWANAGTVTATGFTSPTIYVNGVESAGPTIVAGKWQHIAVTSATAENASNLDIGRTSDTNYLEGTIDEVRISNTARTADQIAEAYRAGQNHRLERTITSTDLSAKSKLPFYVASDRPGTFLEATVGESAYANYSTDANTVGLWHLEEQTGIANTYIKDSSSSNFSSATITGTTYVQGKIGKARGFNGSSDDISFGDVLDMSGDFTIDTWIYSTATGGQGIVDKYATNREFELGTNGSNQAFFEVSNTSGSKYLKAIGSTVLAGDNKWHHIAGVIAGNVNYVYVDGILEGTDSATSGTRTTNISDVFMVGARSNGGNPFAGTIDEVRVSNTARTADQIRQTYEIGRRTHPITIDFVSSPQAAYSSGTSVTINNPSGTTALTDTLSVGDTMIFKENINGTETVSQATVTAIANTTSTYGTATLSSPPSFPSGGYSTSAKVFKWQREYFDLTGSLTTHRDAVTRLTLRVTDGSQGSNIWLDDFRSNTNYINDNTPDSFDTATGIGTYSNTSITSTVQRYFQYRAILSSWDTPVSSQLTSATIDFNRNLAPAAPAISAPTSGALQVSLTPAVIFSATDTESDYIRYKLQIATDTAFSQNLQTFTQPSGTPQTGWSGQDTQGTPPNYTAYTSGTTATYTLQSALSPNTVYYIRAYAVDPAGTNLWSNASSTIGFITICDSTCRMRLEGVKIDGLKF